MSVNQVIPVSESCTGDSGSQKSSRWRMGSPVLAITLKFGDMFFDEGVDGGCGVNWLVVEEDKWRR